MNNWWQDWQELIAHQLARLWLEWTNRQVLSTEDRRKLTPWRNSNAKRHSKTKHKDDNIESPWRSA